MKRLTWILCCSLPVAGVLMVRFWPTQPALPRQITASVDWSRVTSDESHASVSVSVPTATAESPSPPNIESAATSEPRGLEQSSTVTPVVTTEPAWVCDIETECRRWEQIAADAVDCQVLRGRREQLQVWRRQLDEQTLVWLSSAAQSPTSHTEIAFRLKVTQRIRDRLDHQEQELSRQLAALTSR